MSEAIKVLDHGYVRLIECWGHGDAGINAADEPTEDDMECGIIEAARQSTQGSFRGWEDGDCERCGYPTANELHDDCCPDGVGHKRSSGDKRLLAFLHNNRHATPFEFSGMTIEVQAPIAVFREWHRHRTQCLAGDTMIACVTPAGTTYQRSIKSLFELKHGGVVDSMPKKHRNGYSKAGTPVYREARRKDAWRVRVLPNCQNRTLRTLDEETGEFTTGQMADIWESGVKEVFLLETIKGFSVRASADHPFWTRDGWVKLKNILPGMEVARMGKVALNERPIPPSLRQGIGVWTSMMRGRLIREKDQCYICQGVFKRDELILDHVVPVSQSLLTALDEKNLKPACIGCSRQKTNTEQPSREGMTGRGIRWERVRKEVPKVIGEEMTYDIMVEGSHHNYVANGLVVHNSYNEMSARYAPLPDINYLPTAERCLMVGGKNRQAGAIKGADEITHEAALEWMESLSQCYVVCEETYQQGLRVGIPKELARLCLPVGRYSRMRASADLRNWLGFLTLRMDPQAQWEIRQFANVVGSIVERRFPRTWELFRKGLKS